MKRICFALSVIAIGITGLWPSPVDAQWAHCKVYADRAYRAAQASNIPLVQEEERRYFACVNKVPIPPGPQNQRTAPLVPPPHARDTTFGAMQAKNHYCGSSGGLEYFCPKNKRCDPTKMGRCIDRPGKAAFVPKTGRVCNPDSTGKMRCVNKHY